MKSNKKFALQNRLWPGRGFDSINYISDPPPVGYANRLPRRLCILGSTGSIGQNALETIDKDFFSIRTLAGGYNMPLLAKQATLYRPAYLTVAEEKDIASLYSLLPKNYHPTILWGEAGYSFVARDEQTDCVLSCQTGIAGLPGTISACASGKVIALANKESLVLAGGMLRKLAALHGSAILPVDSEHYAFFQCCAGRANLPHIFLLTASGGPFLGKASQELKEVTPEQALEHPNWQMGKKISIDSATLMNKGLELIEAIELYGLPEERIKILVHPQSIVHSLVQFQDNSILGQLSVPDMKLPISGCLYWPYTQKNSVHSLDLFASSPLTFEPPDMENFPCLSLVRKACRWTSNDCWKELGLNPAFIVLDIANEIAVQMFLEKRCAFTDIAVLIEKALQELVYTNQAPFSIDECAGEDITTRGIIAIRKLEKLTAQFMRKNLKYDATL